MQQQEAKVMNRKSMSGLSFGGVSKWIVAAAVGFSLTVAQAAPVSGLGTWETTLQGRDINGNPVPLLVGGNPNPAAVFFYDTVLQLTWLANWNLGGEMTWDDAMAWAAALNINGYNGWFLPGVLDNNNDGCDSTNTGSDCGYWAYGSEAGRRAGSALAHMWYDTLGNLPDRDQNGDPWDPVTNPIPSPPGASGLVNTGAFSNMEMGRYWTSTEYAGGSQAWNFLLDQGYQDFDNKDRASYAVAVRRGDLQPTPVPEPGTFGALLAGLAALSVARTRRRL